MDKAPGLQLPGFRPSPLMLGKSLNLWASVSSSIKSGTVTVTAHVIVTKINESMHVKCSERCLARDQPLS